MTTALWEHLANGAQRFAMRLRQGFDNSEVLAVAEAIAADALYSVADDAYVRPCHVAKTWNDREWFSTVLKGRSKLDGLKVDCGPSVLGFWAGTGNGKSHRMMELQRFRPREIMSEVKTVTEVEAQLVDVPDVDCFVYVTYHVGQSLAFDRAHPEKAIYFRVLLRSMGMTNNGCDQFLSQHREVLSTVDETRLLDLVCTQFVRKNVKHLAIGLDELRCLLTDRQGVSHPSIPVTTSRLGRLAVALEKKHGIRCTSLVASLTDQVFAEEPNDHLKVIRFPLTTADAINSLTANLLPTSRQTDGNRALIRAVAGAHFRSAVVAINLFDRCNSGLTPESVFPIVLDAMETKLQSFERNLIREQIIGTLRGQDFGDSRQRFIDASGAVAPAFVFAAFDGCDGFEANHHPAQRIFQISAYLESPKQLERCRMYYDQLRALHDLPVVPIYASVFCSGQYDFSLFHFRLAIAQSAPNTGNIFEFGLDGQVALVQGWQPSPDRYMLPSDPNHPWIDRACVAFAGGTRCLVIYRDKITTVDFQEVVQEVNNAASILKTHLGYPVLCVLHMVEAPHEQTKHSDGDGVALDSKFEHPYILVRLNDLRKFYGATFAVSIEQMMDRNGEAGVKPVL